MLRNDERELMHRGVDLRWRRSVGRAADVDDLDRKFVWLTSQSCHDLRVIAGLLPGGSLWMLFGKDGVWTFKGYAMWPAGSPPAVKHLPLEAATRMAQFIIEESSVVQVTTLSVRR